MMIYNNDILIDILTRMLKIRLFEEKVVSIAKNNEIQTPVHLYIGQEAIAAAVSVNLNNDDYVYSTHRNHGHYIAKGGNMNKLMAEIYCRDTGCSRGRGGSMHSTDRGVGFVASAAIVAGSIPLAVGSALAAKQFNKRQVSVAFFGDGATDEGVFYECLNLATLYNLPIVFVCENNSFATHQPDFLRQSNINVAERVKGFNINVCCVDGNNPIELYEKTKEKIATARKENKPALIECKTYRWLSHAGYWQDLDVWHRSKEDVESWMNKCPINMLSNILLNENALSENKIIEIKNRLNMEIEESAKFAKNSKYPDSNLISEGLFSSYK